MRSFDYIARMTASDWVRSHDFSICLLHSSRCRCRLAVNSRFIAAILERPVIEKILAHLGLDPQPPPKGRVREAGLHFAA